MNGKMYVMIFCSIVLLLGGIWIYKLIWGQPLSFNHFVERTFIKQALRDPECLTFLGSLDHTPLDFHSGKLTDISATHNQKTVQYTQEDLSLLHHYDRSKLLPQQQLTYDILEDSLQSTLALYSFGYGTLLDAFTPYPVNQFFGIQNSLPEFMMGQHPLTTKKNAKDYINRLAHFDRKFSQLIEELQLRAQNGVIPPLFVIEKVLIETKQFIGVPPEQNTLYTSFQKRIEALHLDPSFLEALNKKLVHTIKTKVYPSYQQLIAFLEKQKTSANNDAGVWKLPHGDAFYAFCLKRHTTTDYSAEKIHEIGLTEVARIQGEMEQILQNLGYQVPSIAKTMDQLTKDPQFLFPDSPEGRKEVLHYCQSLFDDSKDTIARLFVKVPQIALKVEAVPEFKEKTAPVAYYEPPSLNGSRPGIFYVNVSDMKNFPKFTIPTTAFHEGIPGHHLQFSYAMEIKGLPTFRRINHATAFGEGWALYAEQLSWEYGLEQDPYANLGRLQMELLRAVRLVVDTGIHFKGWTREQAIQYMIDNTGMNESGVIAEVERYIVMPGQACSYLIGMKKLLELREKAKAKLGSDFDIKLFHDLVLKNGSMPLFILEKYMTQELDLSPLEGHATQ